MNTLGSRLQQVLNDKGITQEKLANMINVSQNTISLIVKGSTKKPRNILEIATALGVDAHWLKTGEGNQEIIKQSPLSDTIQIVERSAPSTANTVRVEILDLEASAGNGTFLTRAEQGLLAQEFDLAFFRQQFGRTDGKNLKILAVSGDSMEPTLTSGDLLYVDVAENYFSVDGVYVFTFDEQTFVKRLQKVGKKMIVISDNRAYKEWELHANDAVYIHGRVVFSLPMKMKKW
ncbi:XRE family transcriptional regulator [Gallibacterium anatis]|uniref:Transcriptional regulator n=1 Tax=Gallibacterium anatis TaxID=750 RepID=A0A1A7P3Z5_9PAST|nr:helix-turn-helix transcriptional regulator [Gallibacterium anatis]OBW97177.1 transcriptional regulator [Gallibacterium anatis]OBW99299.1 transcriptional regulator [Gallibacterium anatis]OZN49971.1 transcriptional regulator [Gallibacterium anatis]